MEKTLLISRLIKEYGYPPDGASLVADDLMRCDPRVRDGFHAWWDTGSLPDLYIEGYTVQRLIGEHGMQPVAAFLTLDWLARDPDRATTSLHRGHDRVSVRR